MIEKKSVKESINSSLKWCTINLGETEKNTFPHALKHYIEVAIDYIDKTETINDHAIKIHQNAIDHGWWIEKRSFGDITALVHSELSEAFEEHREGRPMVWIAENGKPEGIAVEMADAIIRILDWAAAVGIDMNEIINLKHQYNLTRP